MLEPTARGLTVANCWWHKGLYGTRSGSAKTRPESILDGDFTTLFILQGSGSIGERCHGGKRYELRK